MIRLVTSAPRSLAVPNPLLFVPEHPSTLCARLFVSYVQGPVIAVHVRHGDACMHATISQVALRLRVAGRLAELGVGFRFGFRV